MKTLSVPVIALLSVVVGVAIGFGMTMSQFANEQGVNAPAVPMGATSGHVRRGNQASQPKVIVLGEADFNFGVMERGETMRHTFQLKNIGKAAATLKKGETTCKCTLSELAHSQAQPGETVDVVLQWKPNSFADSFRQSATIETNDPDNKLVRLEVHGRVIQTVRAIPESIVLSNISANESRSAVAYVYCYRDREFELSFDHLGNTDLKDYFDVQVELLSQQLIDAEPEAFGGAKVTVTVKPGLPIGPLDQVLHFTSNVAEVPALTISVHGTVAGDISILGSKSLYDSEHRLITIGAVSGEKGGVYRLQVLVKGSQPKDVELSIGKVEPADVLQVELATDQPTEINNGSVMLYPLTITIPPGTKSAAYLGQKGQGGPRFGKIIIETTHPQAKQVLLYVKFAVQG